MNNRKKGLRLANTNTTLWRKLIPYAVIISVLCMSVVTALTLTDKTIVIDDAPLTKLEYNDTTNVVSFIGNFSFDNATIKHYAETASYIIFKEGDMVYAKNGSTGKIDFSGTDASTVIQSAIDNLPSGKIYIKAGTYIISSAIAPKSNIEIVGEGINKTVLDASNQGCAIFHQTTSINNFAIRDLYLLSENNNAFQLDIYNAKYFTIQNIKCRNTATGYGYGIYLQSCKYFNIKDIIIDTRGTGICVYSSSNGCISGVIAIRIQSGANDIIRVEKSNHITVGNVIADGTASSDGIYRGINIRSSEHINVINCAITKTRDAAYLIAHSNYVNIIGCIGSYTTSSAGGVWARNVTHLTIADSQFNYNYYDGILIGETQTSGEVSEYIVISNTQTINNNQAGGERCGIRLINGNGITRKAIIENCIAVDNQDTPTQYDGIQTVSSSGDNIIRNNIVFGNTNKQINPHTDDQVSGNLGYITENSGSATITSGSTSVTVNHGLAGTPTTITVTPAGNIGNVWVDSITSTSFTIHCETAPSSDTTVYWYAEYKP